MAVWKLFSVTLLLIYSAGGLFGAEFNSVIIGGQDAPTGSWPWMVNFNISSNKHHSWRCGGTILTNYWILTAAHCWDRKHHLSLNLSKAWFGSNHLQQGNGRHMGVFLVVTHPLYQAVDGGFINDIALVKLEKKLNFSQLVRPVRLPCAKHVFTNLSECWLTGWGNIKNHVPLPDPEALQQVKIHIISQKKCREIYPDLGPHQLCAGDKAGGKGACEGDHGGPLVCRADDSFVQVGITSSSDCNNPHKPGVYTNVSSFLTFIDDFVHPQRKNRC